MPRWYGRVLLGLAAILLLGLFSGEISDTDFWWHLKTGEYIWQTHRLPDPDPFAYTTATATNAYAAESTVRHFNLTHEWFSQVLLYLVYSAAGLTGIVILRAGMLMVFCALVGWVAYRRCHGFYRSLAAGLMAAVAVQPFAVDRPYLVTFLLLAITIAILDSGNAALFWLLPPIMLVWANSHGGWVLGLAILGAWCAQGLWLRWRRLPVPGGSRLSIACAVAALVAGVNPNGFRAIRVLWSYRSSFLTSTLAEWQPPHLWPPGAYSVLLIAGVVVLLAAGRRARPVDWILLATFSAASLLAGRNTFLIGFLSPVLIATYVPWRKPAHAYPQILAGVLLVGALVTTVASGHSFQLRAADWAFPAGPAEFLRSHKITQRMFNTYEYGGYLIWRLWPQERVFIDGRALSESVFKDYGRILYTNGGGTPELLDQYGIEVIVMNTFEYSSGVVYTLAPLLAESEGGEWKLVYADATGVVFMRHPPEGMAVLDGARVFDAMQGECEAHIAHEPRQPACARALGLMFASTGEPANARRWLGTYLQHLDGKDPEAEAAFQNLAGR